MPKIKQTEVEVTKRKTVFETSDGKTFSSRDKADAHQYGLDYLEVEVEVPGDIRVRDLVAWAEALQVEHGPKAKFVQRYHWGTGDRFMIVRKR